VTDLSIALHDSSERVELLAGMLPADQYRVSAGPVWISGHHRGFLPVNQGWKLHVAARPATLDATLARILPTLITHACSFKMAAGTDILRELSSAGSSPGSVGKAFTVYPPQERVADVGLELADLLAGFAAPRIVSDRQVRVGSPVYYRYGPIVPTFRATENGDIEPALTAPDGTLASGVAGPSFTLPAWAGTDPFAPATARSPEGSSLEAAGGKSRLLGGRYRPTAGIARGARGMVCRAVDVRTGSSVIVKQASAYVGENPDGTDVRDHLRNERRILEALAAVPAVPRLRDHFVQGDSEFLVTDDVGLLDLRRDVADHGRYLPGATGPRSLGRLAEALLAILDDVHAQGVVVRDLAPKNVIVDAQGGFCLVDFELSSLHGLQCYGWTPGYSSPEQRRNAPGRIEDDYFSLGATLAYAATGMEPIHVDRDDSRNVKKTLDILTNVYPCNPMATTLRGLLSMDAEVRRLAAAAIRGGTTNADKSSFRLLGQRRRGTVSDDMLDDIIEHCLQEVLRSSQRLLEPKDLPRGTTVYLGSAGIGLELLHHLDRPGVAEALGELAEWTAGAQEVAERPRGLMFGSMGTAVFLVSAGVALHDSALLEQGLSLLSRDVGAPRDTDREDHTHGLAGLGTGYLIIHRLTGGLEHLRRARLCAQRLTAGRCQATDFDGFPDQRSAGIDVRYGFGHGAAGIADFLLSCAALTPGDEGLRRAAAREYDRVLEALPVLAATVRSGAARPMSVSWCQGLAGVGASLVTAATASGSDGRALDYLQAARMVADVSLQVAPRVPMVSQCCGLAGLGEFLVDLAAIDGDESFLHAARARTVASDILTRSGGDSRRPAVPDHSLMTSSPEWGSGTAGALTFFRRLRHGGPRLWTSAWGLPDALRPSPMSGAGAP
jgi:serine/threonine protein kinase